jgi:hypothetical protein
MTGRSARFHGAALLPLRVTAPLSRLLVGRSALLGSMLQHGMVPFVIH